MLLLTVFFFLFSVACGQGIRCYAWQYGNGEDVQEIVCPGSDNVCVRYRALNHDEGELQTTTCVTTENCQLMKDNPQIYGDVYCCDTELCNNPNSVGSLTIQLTTVVAFVAFLSMF